MSNYDDARYSLDATQPLPLVTLAGDTVTVHVTALDTSPIRVALFGEIEVKDWRVIAAQGAFHTDLDSGVLPGEPSNVEVELVLRTPVANGFEDGEALLAGLFGTDPTAARQTEAWLLASAEQSVEIPDADGATASSGFRTQWANPIV